MSFPINLSLLKAAGSSNLLPNSVISWWWTSYYLPQRMLSSAESILPSSHHRTLPQRTKEIHAIRCFLFLLKMSLFFCLPTDIVARPPLSPVFSNISDVNSFSCIHDHLLSSLLPAFSIPPLIYFLSLARDMWKSLAFLKTITAAKTAKYSIQKSKY